MSTLIEWLIALAMSFIMALGTCQEAPQTTTTEHEAEIGTALYCERDLDTGITRCWEDGVEVTP